jgi:capsular polysaccharide biosynthesis protein
VTRASDAARNTGNDVAGSRNTPGTDPATPESPAGGRQPDRGRSAGQSGAKAPWPVSSTPVGGSSGGSAGKPGSGTGSAGGPGNRGGNGGSGSGNPDSGGRGSTGPGNQGGGNQGGNQGSANHGNQGSGNQSSTARSDHGSRQGACNASAGGTGSAGPGSGSGSGQGSGSGSGSGSGQSAGKSASATPGSGTAGPGAGNAGSAGHGPVASNSRLPGAGALPSGPPRSRPPLPGPPPGVRLPGPPMGAAPRFTPQPPPRRGLTGGQRSQLVFLTVALLVVGAVLGFAASLVLPTQYAARTTIQYNIAGENTGDFLKTDRNLTTQTVLLTSRNVLGPVADANGISVDTLTKQVSASILNSSDIIQLQVKNSSPDTAVTLANAIAKQYIAVANSSGPQGYLQSQLDGVKKQQASPGTAAETTALATRAATLQAQLDQLNLTQNQSSVLVAAYAVTDPVSPNKSLAAITGGICGLIIALMTVVTLSRRWTRN